MNMPSLADRLAGATGKPFYLKVHPNRSRDGGEFSAPVLVTDVRYVYGKLQYLVSPVGGKGSLWVNEHKLLTELDSPDFTSVETED